MDLMNAVANQEPFEIFSSVIFELFFALTSTLKIQSLKFQTSLSGFESENNGNCVDIDECSIQTDDCHALSECQNTMGSFACVCVRGYFGDAR